MAGTAHDEITKMVGFFVAMLLIVLLATYTWVLVTVRGQDLDKQLPDLQRLVRIGCTVSGPIAEILDVYPHRRDVWVVEFWAAHLTEGKVVKDWELLYAYRKNSERATKDCNKFLERVRRARKRQIR